jgi:hypothetical protein
LDNGYFSFEEYFILGKKRSRLKSPIRQKNEVLEDTLVFKTEVFTISKHLKVFDTSFFLETKVFTEYFKITLKPNGAKLPLATDGHGELRINVRTVGGFRVPSAHHDSSIILEPRQGHD